MEAHVLFVRGRLVAILVHSMIPEGGLGGSRGHSIGLEDSMPPSMRSHSRDTRVGLEHDF